jgi:hypothetical protein
LDAGGKCPGLGGGLGWGVCFVAHSDMRSLSLSAISGKRVWDNPLLKIGFIPYIKIRETIRER